MPGGYGISTEAGYGILIIRILLHFTLINSYEDQRCVIQDENENALVVRIS